MLWERGSWWGKGNKLGDGNMEVHYTILYFFYNKDFFLKHALMSIHINACVLSQH